MPFSTYQPDRMGEATISPAGPLETGSMEELVLVYTAGFYGVDDSGMLKISWRTTSDMAKPQFEQPNQPGFTSVEASNGAVLECRFDRNNIRPWTNTLTIRVNHGYLKAGDTITLRLGDRQQGSPGIRLQTNAEASFQFRIYVDPFATYEFIELPEPLSFPLIPSAAVRWKAILPSLVMRGEPFRLAIVAEDLWGNPADGAGARLVPKPSVPIPSLPARIEAAKGALTTVLNGLVVNDLGDIDLLIADQDGRTLCRANPMRIVDAAPLRCYWGDLHGQSEETVGTNSADAHFAFARDKAFVDIVGHQGNDFQITDAFWAELNRLSAAYTQPGRFLAIPGYEWSGNTGLGGDRNVFYKTEGRPIHRSSHILLHPDEISTAARPTAHDLFAALRDEDAVTIAHVGGRYADMAYAHDARLETAVEVHSSWGTFEWILHDALRMGHRVGVVCHSDDHKGRPGATTPGASSFGAIGGLTCYLMPELTRDALFEALRRRHHYGTTGARIFLGVTGHFDDPVEIFPRDPATSGEPATDARIGIMGDIIRPGAATMRLDIEALGTASIEAIDVFHGTEIAARFRPEVFSDSRRIGIRWQGAEYRGRGRETHWRGEVRLVGNRFARAEQVNFLNPELRLMESDPGVALAWRSVTTGNLVGLDMWLDQPTGGRLEIETNHVCGAIDLAALADEEIELDAGGLGRRVSVRRLPERGGARKMIASHNVRFIGPSDLPVYVRVTQEDGHQAWSSPIYLVD